MSDRIEKAVQKNEWPLVEIDGLSLHVSPLLSGEPGVKHAFTTRLGGDSLEPLNWFNLGRHIDDGEGRQDAMKNRERLCRALNMDFSRLVVPGQVHSNRVVCAEAKDLAQVDSVATDRDGVPVLLHFADCVPIILFDPSTPALAVVHAGWRGTAQAIVRQAVVFLHKSYGVQPGNILAAVGPAIGSCCYPTSAEAAESLAQSVSHGKELIQWLDQPRPDLKALNAMQLLESGVTKIDVSDLCTACQPELFYSHRFSSGRTGRQGAIASINYIS
jgi:YfiH family protein